MRLVRRFGLTLEAKDWSRDQSTDGHQYSPQYGQEYDSRDAQNNVGASFLNSYLVVDEGGRVGNLDRYYPGDRYSRPARLKNPQDDTLYTQANPTQSDAKNFQGTVNGNKPQPQDISKKLYSKSIEEYELENRQLKSTVDLLSKRIVELERASQENNMLRSSIIQFRQDIQKQVFCLVNDREPSIHNYLRLFHPLGLVCLVV